MAAERRATKKRSTAARTRTTASGRGSRTSPARRTTGGQGTTVAIPVVTPKVKVMKMHVPARGMGMSYVGDAGRLAASYLPSADRMAFYGGLGLAAIVGILDWPVAAAIGLGTMIARRTFRREPRRPSALRAAAAARAEGTTVSERMAEAAAAGAGGTSRSKRTSRATRTRSTRTGGASRTGGTSRTSTSRTSTSRTSAARTGGGTRSSGTRTAGSTGRAQATTSA